MFAMLRENEVLLAVTMVFAFVIGPAVGIWMIVDMRVKGRPWSYKKD